jgi:hypothetical protein
VKDAFQSLPYLSRGKLELREVVFLAVHGAADRPGCNCEHVMVVDGATIITHYSTYRLYTNHLFFNSIKSAAVDLACYVRIALTGTVKTCILSRAGSLKRDSSVSLSEW